MNRTRATVICGTIGIHVVAVILVSTVLRARPDEPVVSLGAPDVDVEVVPKRPDPPATAHDVPVAKHTSPAPRARDARPRTTSHEVVFVPDPPASQDTEPGGRAESGGVSPPVVSAPVWDPWIGYVRVGDTSLLPLPHQTVSVVPDYDWAWGSSGAVQMSIGIDVSGHVELVQIHGTSGNAALDDGLDSALRRRRFVPCTMESGEAVPCVFEYRFDYVVTRRAGGIRDAETCGHVVDGQPSCCDAFER